MNPKRSPALAVLAGAIGGLLVLLTSGREWAHTGQQTSSGASTNGLSVTGHQVTGAIPAVAYALLALALATLASNGLIRRMVGGFVTIVGAVGVTVAFSARSNVSSALADQEHGATGIAIHASANGWWVITLIGSVFGLGAGLLTVRYSGAWERMSSKYDAPSEAMPARDPAAITWDALDRGEDPTE